jgi:hypothetical protein
MFAPTILVILASCPAHCRVPFFGVGADNATLNKIIRLKIPTYIMALLSLFKHFSPLPGHPQKKMGVSFLKWNSSAGIFRLYLSAKTKRTNSQ